MWWMKADRRAAGIAFTNRDWRPSRSLVTFTPTPTLISRKLAVPGRAPLPESGDEGVQGGVGIDTS